MLQRVRIGRHERGFLYHDGDYRRFLRSGVHWIWGLGRTVRRSSTQSLALEGLDLDVVLRDAAVREDVAIADLGDDERALVWVDGRIHAVLGSGRHAFWTDLHRVEVEVRSASELRLAHAALDAILAVDAGARLSVSVVPKGSVGLLYVNEKLEGELGPGRYAFWRDAARVAVEMVEMRESSLDVAGQEILTEDKVTLRINLLATYRVTEPVVAVESTRDLHGALYRELQLALREAVGARTLDGLLAAKEAVNEEIHAAVEPRAKALGVALGSVGIRDVILPGEMKTLLNQVIEAEKRAQANLIARREETAATRSLLNTARLIESSPTLLRLKELEAAERIAGSIESVQLIGGGVEGLLRQFLPAARGSSEG